MQCPKCGGANEAGARFCGTCGATLAAPRPAPPPAPAASRVYCQRCGTPNPAGSKFCENCGAPLGAAASVSPQPVRAAAVESMAAKPGKPSGAWWLLPVFFGWLGGIIAWAVVKDNDGAIARKMLGLGFLITFLWIAVVAVLGMLGSGLSFSDFSFD